MVKSLDEILQKEFDLPMGLGDNSKIQREISIENAQNKLNVVTSGQGRGKKSFEEFHKVQILDPATGTGTFLLEVFNQIYKKFENNQEIWKSYAQNDLIPRIHGFEILMASYTMVHLKLAMFLSEKGVEIDKRLSVYLTNSLEESVTDDGSLFSLTKWLTDEAQEASEIKNNKHVMVVIGNPPYSGVSQNNGDYIMSLIEEYKYIDGKHFGEKSIG
jgi:predicted helicase